MLGAGCGVSEHPLLAPELGALPPAEQVILYPKDRAPVRWHAVVFRPDSVSGIPSQLPLPCDRCRIGLARADVDSIRQITGAGVKGALWWAVPLGVILAMMAGH